MSTRKLGKVKRIVIEYENGETEELDNEVIIFKWSSDRAFVLNPYRTLSSPPEYITNSTITFSFKEKTSD